MKPHDHHWGSPPHGLDFAIDADALTTLPAAHDELRDAAQALLALGVANRSGAKYEAKRRAYARLRAALFDELEEIGA